MATISRPPNQVERAVFKLRHGRWSEEPDVVAAEEPLEIRLLWQEGETLQRRSIAVTMRTPGDDFQLAAGFLLAEGVITGMDDVVDLSYCLDEDEDQAFNIVNVTLRPGSRVDERRLERNFFTNSSCGVCGKATLEALEVRGCAVIGPGFRMPPDVIQSLPGRLREAQKVFETTGGLHAAGLFDTNGTLMAMKEDVGRHNAVDKLLGAALTAGHLPLDDRALCLSGRASFELLQKALVARIPLVAAVGAPSSLAVQLAESFGITLIGFLRADGFNVYCGRERVLG